MLLLKTFSSRARTFSNLPRIKKHHQNQITTRTYIFRRHTHMCSAYDTSKFRRISPESPVLQFDQIEKSDSDDRHYRLLLLENQLPTLLVSDPKTDKASAALDVRVGALFDPDHIPGLAHFLEHMVFLGTEKYPKENEYSQYLSENGGYSNAYTGLEHTNYYFEVGSNALEGALDRFAQFFICPLFDPSCTDRELKAVDSENKKNLQNDHWRLFQLERHLSDPKHPFNKFATGNIDTLKNIPEKEGTDVRKELLDFHQKYYSANLMRLVVVGKEPLDTLANWTMEKFSAVPNKNVKPPCVEGLPYKDEQLLKRVTVRPVKDKRQLTVMWTFPDYREHYEAHPERYISHLIGHEGAGSLLSLLKKKGLVNYLSAGSMNAATGFGFFNVFMELTEEGLEKYEEVVKDVFRYVHVITSGGPQQRVFDEVRGLAELDFKFREKMPASDYASSLASSMQQPYTAERILSGAYTIRKYDPELISEALNTLKTDSFNVVISSQSFPAENMEKEPWYGTEYTAEKISKNFMEDLGKISKGIEKEEELFLPTPNEFIPTKFDTFKPAEGEPLPVVVKAPVAIRDTKLVKLWHKQDDQFFLPKLVTEVYMQSPLVYATPRNAAMTNLFADLVTDSMVEYTYNASVAGLQHSLTAEAEGLVLSIDGYNHKAHILLEEVITKARNFKVDKVRFQLLKEHLLRRYKNFTMEEPYHQSIYYSLWILQDKIWTYQEKLEQLESVTAEELQLFIPSVFSNMHIDMLANGSIGPEDALKMAESVENIIKPQALCPSQLFKNRPLVLPKGSKYVFDAEVFDKSNVNSSVTYCVQIGSPKDTKKHALLVLLAQCADEPCFNQLRTKEQLGYLVWSGKSDVAGISYFRVIIQSERGAKYLEQRIESFLTKLGEIIANMSEDDFKGQVGAAITKLQEKDKNITQESQRFWKRIQSGLCNFHQNDEDVKHLQQFTKEDLVKFYNEHIANPDRKLSVHLRSQLSTEHCEMPEDNALFSDFVKLKSMLPLGPVPTI